MESAVIQESNIDNLTTLTNELYDLEKLREIRLKALEYSTSPTIIINRQSTIILANASVETLLGWPHQELTGKSLTMLMPERMRVQHLAGIKRYFDTGQRALDWTMTNLPALHRDGYEVNVDVSFNEFTQNGDKFIVGILISRDQMRGTELDG
jgi:HTH-type transcriptional regulator, bacterioopsin transcriptional activator and related proteins